MKRLSLSAARRTKISAASRDGSHNARVISIRIDEDVLEYFKLQGKDYKRRINAVWRSHMQQKRKRRA
jgi:uncharacterized protein (DUF4415 family)